MASFDPIYTLFSDELARVATITLDVGTAEDTYDVDKLVDDNPAHLFKANETAVAIQIAFTEKTPAPFWALIHCTTEEDDDVRLQGDDDADWVTPSMDIPYPQAGWTGAQLTRWPINPWIDITQEPTYDEYGFKNYRLAFGLNTPLAQALQIGQLRIHPTFGRLELDRNVPETRTRRIIENSTAFDVSTIYGRGTSLWKGGIDMGLLTTAERAVIQAHWDNVGGRLYPWVAVPDPAINLCYLVRYATTDETLKRIAQGFHGFNHAVAEVGRGLRPGVAV